MKWFKIVQCEHSGEKVCADCHHQHQHIHKPGEKAPLCWARCNEVHDTELTYICPRMLCYKRRICHHAGDHSLAHDCNEKDGCPACQPVAILRAYDVVQ